MAVRQIMQWRKRFAVVTLGYFGALAGTFGAVLTATVLSRSALHDMDARWDPAKVAVGGVLTGMVNQETGERGFVITRQESFLAPYDQGRAQTATALDQLARLLPPEFDADLARVRSAVTDWQERVAIPETAAVRSGHPEQAVALVSSGTGKQVFDAFRARLGELEQRIDGERTHDAGLLRQASDRTLWALGLSVLVSVAAAAISALWFSRWAAGAAAAAGRQLGLATNLTTMSRALGSAMSTDEVGGILRAHLPQVLQADPADVVLDHDAARPAGESEAPARAVAAGVDIWDPQGRRWGRIGVRRSADPQARQALSTVAGMTRQTLERIALTDLEHRFSAQMTTLLSPRAAQMAGAARGTVDIAARYLPAASALGLGGDWYDVLPADRGRVTVVVGDVVGHGVEAIAQMAQLRTLLAAQAHSREGIDPDRFFQHAHEMLPADTGMLATALCAVLDPDGESVRVTVAGHPPPLIWTPAHGSVEAVTSRHPPLGFAAAVVTAPTTPWPEDSLLVAFTDGLYERRSRSQQAGYRSLMHRLDDVADRSPEEIIDALLGELDDTDHDDDVALVVIRNTVRAGAAGPT